MAGGRPKGYPKSGGRQKGTPNKTTTAFREAVLHVYEAIGGDTQFAAWAKDNQTDFYRLCGRLIPQEVSLPPGSQVSLIIKGA